MHELDGAKEVVEYQFDVIMTNVCKASLTHDLAYVLTLVLHNKEYIRHFVCLSFVIWNDDIEKFWHE